MARPEIVLSDMHAIWRTIMNSGLAKINDAVQQFAAEYGYQITTALHRDVWLDSIDGDMLLAEMQASMSVGF